LRDPDTLCDDRNLDPGVTDIIEGAGRNPRDEDGLPRATASDA
jgi:hypothetical protein